MNSSLCLALASLLLAQVPAPEPRSPDEDAEIQEPGELPDTPRQEREEMPPDDPAFSRPPFVPGPIEPEPPYPEAPVEPVPGDEVRDRQLPSGPDPYEEEAEVPDVPADEELEDTDSYDEEAEPYPEEVAPEASPGTQEAPGAPVREFRPPEGAAPAQEAEEPQRLWLQGEDDEAAEELDDTPVEEAEDVGSPDNAEFDDSDLDGADEMIDGTDEGQVDPFLEQEAQETPFDEGTGFEDPAQFPEEQPVDEAPTDEPLTDEERADELEQRLEMLEEQLQEQEEQEQELRTLEEQHLRTREELEDTAETLDDTLERGEELEVRREERVETFDQMVLQLGTLEQTLAYGDDDVELQIAELESELEMLEAEAAANSGERETEQLSEARYALNMSRRALLEGDLFRTRQWLLVATEHIATARETAAGNPAPVWRDVPELPE